MSAEQVKKPGKICEKIKTVQLLYDDIYKYINAIELKESDIELSIDVEQELIDIQGSLKKLHAMDSDYAIIDVKYTVWHLVNRIMYKISYIIYELETLTGNPRLTANMSDTNIEVVGNLLNNIRNIYNKYEKTASQLDVEVMLELTHDIKLCDANNANKLSVNVDLVKQYPFAISLFAYIMQKNLDACVELSDAIAEMVEDVKDYILLINTKSSKSTATVSKLYIQNPHIKTFGLTPHGSAKQLSELSKEIFPNMSEKLSVSKFNSITKSKNVCIVVLNRIIRKPIEFSLWNLMDWKYAKEFLQGNVVGIGINKQDIGRFNTIYFTQAEKKSSQKDEKWNFGISHYGDLSSEQFIVMENIGGGLFRLLALYTDRDVFKHVSGGGVLATKIQRSKIPEFVDYIKNKGVIDAETRIAIYHKIQETQVLKNIFLPIKFNVDGINLNSQIVDSKFLRNTLYMRLTERCNILIEKDYKNAEKIKTHKDLGQIVHDKELSNIFNSILVEQYDIYTFKNKENVSNFPFSETLKTFLSQLYMLNRDFVRHMHDNFIATHIDDKIFDSESTRNKNIFVRKLCEDVIKTTLDKLISNESNVYQGLIYKTNMLKLSVV